MKKHKSKLSTISEILKLVILVPIAISVILMLLFMYGLLLQLAIAAFVELAKDVYNGALLMILPAIILFTLINVMIVSPIWFIIETFKPCDHYYCEHMRSDYE